MEILIYHLLLIAQNLFFGITASLIRSRNRGVCIIWNGYVSKVISFSSVLETTTAAGKKRGDDVTSCSSHSLWLSIIEKLYVSLYDSITEIFP